MSTEKEAFISSEDRPHVGITPDTPIAELKVRDLRDLLAGTTAPAISPDIYKVILDANKYPLKEVIDIPPKGYYKDQHDLDGVLKYIRDHQIPLVPQLPVGPGPEFDRVVKALSGLTEQVSQLSKEVEALKKERG